MLTLKRFAGESIIIDGFLKLTFVGTRYDGMRLMVDMDFKDDSRSGRFSVEQRRETQVLDNVLMVVHDIGGKNDGRPQARFSFAAPREVDINRSEVEAQIKKEEKRNARKR